MLKKSFIHQPSIYNEVSAREVLPFIIELFDPKSIVDIGCGIGTWLSVAKSIGIEDIQGIDGLYVDINTLLIPEEKFAKKDLTVAFDLNRKYDLALCLEVAEHIDESAADDFVESIVRHADMVLFSAAIPLQGGQFHVNEQWPGYWQSKFSKHGYNYYDIFRPKFWNNLKVEPWYRQNMFLVAKSEVELPFAACEQIENYVHPEIFTYNLKACQDRLKGREKVALRDFYKIAKKRLFNI